MYRITLKPSINIEIIVQTNPVRWKQGHMHEHTFTPMCHGEDYVLLTTGGLDKNSLF